MRVTGIILIVMGILLMVFSGINFKTEKKVADIGPIEINKEENNHIGWPTYAGGIVLIAGVVVLVAGRKK
ncbi:hypothetical protein CJD36_003230 [Flavipsychrobacter stenotrophus]|uniref:DUF3185 domain-containing protein n=1 Tax=Flavipsychrobacter stenotrophus TaxID=2077091 RepID=A0A2S7T1V0_9BACT|nr:hypothetical protein [Flavipsychrobacter stenotrophus]PQJ12775.1 hypothetical protein CJD36_003230 [Flavipsychrobacter stenotrophus]